MDSESIVVAAIAAYVSYPSIRKKAGARSAGSKAVAAVIHFARVIPATWQYELTNSSVAGIGTRSGPDSAERNSGGSRITRRHPSGVTTCTDCPGSRPAEFLAIVGQSSRGASGHCCSTLIPHWSIFHKSSSQDAYVQKRGRNVRNDSKASNTGNVCMNENVASDDVQQPQATV